MPIVYNEFTVLQFTKIQFREKWTLALGDVWIYTSQAATNELYVVSESGGSVVTYIFQNVGEVHVSYDANIIQIPGICVKNATGDITKCKP